MSNLSTTQCRALLDRDLAFRTSTGDLDSVLFIDILNEIEDVFYDLLVEASPNRFLTATSISTGTNPTTIASLYTLDVMGGGVFDDNNGTITNTEMTKTFRGSRNVGYWTEDLANEGGAKINFTPLGVATATKWAVYIPYRTVLTDGATTLFPSRKAHFVKRALLRYFYLWKQSPTVNIADAEFQNTLRQIIGKSNPQHAGTSLSLDSF